MALSTVPAGVAAQAHAYLAHGGPANLAELHAFLSDTVLLTGEGFAPPAELPDWGHLARVSSHESAVVGVGTAEGAATAALSANDTPPQPRDRDPLLPGAPRGGEHRIRGRALAPPSRRTAAVRCRCTAPRCACPTRSCSPSSRQADALVVTVLAAGGRRPAEVSAGGDDEAWDVQALAALDVPILQGLCLTSSRATWAESRRGALPAGHRHPGRRPGVRRPADHGAVLLQGDRRRRPAGLRRRPRALRAGSRGSRSGTPGCGTSRRHRRSSR